MHQARESRCLVSEIADVGPRCNLFDAMACEMSKTNRLLSIDATSSTFTHLPAPKHSKFVLIAPKPSAAAQAASPAWDEEEDSVNHGSASHTWPCTSHSSLFGREAAQKNFLIAHA